jgi:hypothetical protein
MVKLTRDERGILERMVGRWMPLRTQIISGSRMMDWGRIRLDLGREGTPDEEGWFVL